MSGAAITRVSARYLCSFSPTLAPIYKVPTAHCAMHRNPGIICSLHCLSEDRTPIHHWR
ncbi:hypothetical protein BGY98DRAFT_1001113 [Russula aff. rugulosa BPL654]|nr:hypothetical protein BGY98DRAFT_1001113 [Russula aff. rugulosa BPL654]